MAKSKFFKLLMVSSGLALVFGGVSHLSARIAGQDPGGVSDVYSAVWNRAVSSRVQPLVPIDETRELPLPEDGEPVRIQVNSRWTDLEIVDGAGGAGVRLHLSGSFPKKSGELLRAANQGSAVEIRVDDSPSPEAPVFRFNERNLIRIGADNRMRLRVEVPKSRKRSLKLETASGNVNVSVLDLDEVDVLTASGNVDLETPRATRLAAETASGDLRLKGLRADAITIKTVSGDVEMEGVSSRLDVRSTSGDLSIRLRNDRAPGQVALETVSGDIRLKAPAAKAEGRMIVKSVSGEFELPGGLTTDDDENPLRELEAKLGLAGEEFRLSTVSGDIDVR